MGAVSNDDIKWLIDILLSEHLLELEVSEGDCGILVRRADLSSAPAEVQPTPSTSEADDLVAITAPMGGVFYRSAAPDSPPFVEVGDEVQSGETVALIEAMKLYNDIEAPCSGRIERILVEDASRVAADQELMYIKPFKE